MPQSTQTYVSSVSSPVASWSTYCYMSCSSSPSSACRPPVYSAWAILGASGCSFGLAGVAVGWALCHWMTRLNSEASEIPPCVETSSPPDGDNSRSHYVVSGAARKALASLSLINNRLHDCLVEHCSKFLRAARLFLVPQTTPSEDTPSCTSCLDDQRSGTGGGGEGSEFEGLQRSDDECSAEKSSDPSGGVPLSDCSLSCVESSISGFSQSDQLDNEFAILTTDSVKDNETRFLLEGSTQLERKGFVYLVGAGPAGLELLTLKACKLISIADVLVVDDLVQKHIAEKLAKSGCEIVDACKLDGALQTDIIVKHALKSKCVVRLKRGDPLLFGRVWSEIVALRAAGVHFEIVPGVSSALSAPASLNIPITHKDLSQTFTVLSGHDVSTLSWPTLATTDTLIILMASRTLAAIVKRLLEAGKSATTPVVLIFSAHLKNQKAIAGTLGDIIKRTQGHSLSPCVVVIGEVAKFADAAPVEQQSTNSGWHLVSE